MQQIILCMFSNEFSLLIQRIVRVANIAKGGVETMAVIENVYVDFIMHFDANCIHFSVNQI